MRLKSRCHKLLGHLLIDAFLGPPDLLEGGMWGDEGMACISVDKSIECDRLVIHDIGQGPRAHGDRLWRGGSHYVDVEWSLEVGWLNLGRVPGGMNRGAPMIIAEGGRDCMRAEDDARCLLSSRQQVRQVV